MKRLMAALVVTALLGLSASAFAADAAADLYKTKCGSCHGADGTANTPMGKKMEIKSVKDPDVAKMSEKDFVEITTNGKGKMPAYKGKLTPEQIQQVAGYMKGLAK